MPLMTWRDAVVAALARASASTRGRPVSRKLLIEKELPRIVRETGCLGRTPEQTLSRVLQELRDEGCIEFIGRGEYRVIALSD